MGWVEVLAWAVEEGLAIPSAGQPRAAGVVWLPSVCLTQPSARGLGPRATRELCSLCHSLGLLFQGMVAVTMVALAQRVKASERAQTVGR